MDFKFSKDSGDSLQHEAPDEKRKQSALLLLLLVLVGGFTYIYFFTGLIKPLEVVKTAAVSTPAAEPPIVKMPLPPREAEPAKPGVQPVQKPEILKTAAVTPIAVKPAPVPAKTISTPIPAAKPAAPPAKPSPVAISAAPKEEPKKIAAKPTIKKTETVVGAPNKKIHTTIKAKKTATGPWSLVVGNYVLEEALSADLGRIRKAGFQPVVKASTRIKSAMNRLFVAEFPDRDSSQPTLDKLKRHTSDAFVIEQEGKFTVYAGSYMQDWAANSEKERLRGAGFAVTIKHVDIAIPSQNLSIGPYNSKISVDSAVAKLNRLGIKATIVQK